jgi:peroxiredoxin
MNARSMNKILSIIMATAVISLLGLRVSAADEKATPKNDKSAKSADKGARNLGAKSALQDLVGRVTTKLQEGKNTEKDLASELKEFDALLTKHKDEKTDDVAQIHFMRAMLYVQVFENLEKGKELMAQLSKELPETAPGKKAPDVIAEIEQQQRGKQIREKLVVGEKFPDFEEKDLAGKTLSIANYKGKVVLVDFWATWCGPCVAELPHVLKAYEQYHDKGFDVVGISLDRDQEALTSFIKKREMRWPQIFDSKNKLATQYGIESIPTTFLLDGEGKIIGKNIRGEAVIEAVADALPKK